MSNQSSNNKELQDSIAYGVMEDKLHTTGLTKWTIIGVIFAVVLIIAGINLHGYYDYLAKESAAVNAKYVDLENYKIESNQRLTSYGIVDLDQGKYHIPIDSAISIVIQKYNQE